MSFDEMFTAVRYKKFCLDYFFKKISNELSRNCRGNKM